MDGCLIRGERPRGDEQCWGREGLLLRPRSVVGMASVRIQDPASYTRPSPQFKQARGDLRHPGLRWSGARSNASFSFPFFLLLLFIFLLFLIQNFGR